MMCLLSHAFKSSRRDFPVVQLFQTLHSRPRGPWSIPGQGTKAHLPQLKIQNAAAKAWYSQKNKKQKKRERVSIWSLGTCRRSDQSQSFPTASLSRMGVLALHPPPSVGHSVRSHASGRPSPRWPRARRAAGFLWVAPLPLLRLCPCREQNLTMCNAGLKPVFRNADVGMAHRQRTEVVILAAANSEKWVFRTWSSAQGPQRRADLQKVGLDEVQSEERLENWVLSMSLINVWLHVLKGLS